MSEANAPGGPGQSAAELLRPLLVGNQAVDQWPPPDQTGDPWDRFVLARQAFERADVDGACRIWSEIAATPGLESRQYLQAWTFLRDAGRPPPADEAKLVLGVLAEMAVGAGHDVLAAYSDGSCRYLNHAGGATVVEDRSIEPVQTRAHAWLAAGRELARITGPWPQRELPGLPAGHARLAVLTPSGPHFGQGPQSQVMAEAQLRPFVEAATALLLAVVDLSPPSAASP